MIWGFIRGRICGRFVRVGSAGVSAVVIAVVIPAAVIRHFLYSIHAAPIVPVTSVSAVVRNLYHRGHRGHGGNLTA